MNAPMVSALETRIRSTAFKLCFQFQLAPLQRGIPNGIDQVTGRGLYSFTLELNLSNSRTHS